MIPYEDIPGAPEWANELYKRIHANTLLVLTEFHRMRARLESLERWRHSIESERDTEPPTLE